MGKASEAEAALSRLPGVPAAFRRMFLKLVGTALESDAGPPVEVFDAHELVDVNLSQPGYRKELPTALFFASDGASGFYYIDVDGSVDGKVGAVLWGDRSAMTREQSVPTAASLAAFVRAARAGKHHPLRRRPSIGDRDLVDLEALLAEHAADWEPTGPGRSLFFSQIVHTLQCRVTGELDKLYEIADGLRITGRVAGQGARIVPSDELARADAQDGLPERPLEGSLPPCTFPTGFWIGEHEGRRLLRCVGLTGWRGLQEDTIVSVAPGQHPDSGIVLGRLSNVLRAWLSRTS